MDVLGQSGSHSTWEFVDKAMRRLVGKKEGAG